MVQRSGECVPVNIGSGLYKQTGLFPCMNQTERSDSGGRCRIGIGSGFQKQTDDICCGSQVQRRKAIDVSGVHISAMLQQQPHRFRITGQMKRSIPFIIHNGDERSVPLKLIPQKINVIDFQDSGVVSHQVELSPFLTVACASAAFFRWAMLRSICEKNSSHSSM